MSKRTPPIAESEAVLALFRAADRLRRHFLRSLSPRGITLPQYNVLRILRGAGGRLPTMEIRDRMMERAPGITRIIDGLAAKGLVEREPPGRDRRQVPCRLTGAGDALLSELDPEMDAADRHAFRGLTKARLRALVEELRAVEHNLREA